MQPNFGHYLHGVLLLAMFVMLAWTSVALYQNLDMAKSHALFTEALRASRDSLALRITNEHSEEPASTGEWLAVLNGRNKEAPAGGPAFVVNKLGSSSTGAIGIGATNYGAEVHVARPAFRGLEARRAVVTAAGVAYEDVR